MTKKLNRNYYSKHFKLILDAAKKETLKGKELDRRNEQYINLSKTYGAFVRKNLTYTVKPAVGDSWGDFSKDFFGRFRQPVIRWLEINCKGMWGTHNYCFNFELESDALLFKLYWI